MGGEIGFHNVTVTRRHADGQVFHILQRATFTLARTARVAVIGPSGAGKTTLLRLINRLDDPDEGTITLDSEDIRSIPAVELRRRVGMVFQQPRLFDASVRDNLNHPLLLAGRSPLTETAAIGALARVGLAVELLESHSRDLSVGQQQRVALARALVLEPEVLLLDEPTSALDKQTAEVVLDLLVRLNASLQISMVMVTHDTEHAEAFADQALALRHGAAKTFDRVAKAVDWARGRLPAEAP